MQESKKKYPRRYYAEPEELKNPKFRSFCLDMSEVQTTVDWKKVWAKESLTESKYLALPNPQTKHEPPWQKTNGSLRNYIQ